MVLIFVHYKTTDHIRSLSRHLGVTYMSFTMFIVLSEISKKDYPLWEPSQKGGVPVCLQVHNHASLVSSASKTKGGVALLTLCEPSQKGCSLL
jgi:hypothetical protein